MIIVRVWDAFFWATVLFPFFTGGVWIRRPGLYLELSQITVPLLFLVVWGWVITRFYCLDMEKASSIRFLRKLWSLWTQALRKSPIKTLWIGSGIVGLIWSLISVRRHHNFETSPGDLGVFVSAIWNLVNGNGYVSSVKDGINLFCDHQSPIFWLFAPVFYVFPNAETLLVLQGMIMATGGVAIYLLSRQYFQPNSPYLAILPLVYWSLNPVRNAVRFDFHVEIIMLPLFLFAIWAIQSGKRTERALGFFLFFLGLLCKESSGVVATGLGLAWILGSKRRSIKTIGFFSALTGILVFYFDTQVVTKHLNCSYAYQGNYAQFGSTVTDLVLAPFLKPGLFLSHIFEFSRLRFLFFTLFPLAFLPVLNWKYFVGSLPIYLMFFLTQGDHRLNPHYYYGIEPSVILLWALPGGILLAEKLFPKWKNRLPFLLGLCAALALGRSDLFYLRSFSPDSHKQWLRHSFFRRLNPDSSLSASGSMVSHLTNRRWGHFLPKIQIAANGLVDCIIYDPSINNWPLDAEQDAKIRTGQLTQGYDLIYQNESLRVWQRKGANPCFSY